MAYGVGPHGQSWPTLRTCLSDLQVLSRLTLYVTWKKVGSHKQSKGGLIARSLGMTPFPAANRSTSSLIVVLGFRREKGGSSCFTSDARGSYSRSLMGLI